MKQLSSVFNLIATSLFILFGGSATAQLLGDNAFLQGRYVEAAIAPNGSMGSTRIVPSGYHLRSPSFNFWDPGLSAYSGTSANRLMMTYDAGHDGWTTGTPVPYFGDYSMPGTPYEAWSVQIAGARGNADFETYLGAGSGYTGTLAMSGTVTGYTNAGGTLTGTWQGTAGTGGPLQITQTWILDTNASWVRIKVVLKNVSGSALTGVYYMRHLDPDNDETTSGSFNTTNTINYQNDYYHRVMVTAAGTSYTSQTLSLSTKDCRAKCFIGTTWPSGTSSLLSAYYTASAGGAVYTGTNTGDYAIGMVWNLGNIAAGDSTQLTFAYVYNGLLGIDSALALPQLYVNGTATDSVDTITACAFSGDTLNATIVNGATADWTGSTWTWAPSSYLTATTGISVGIVASALTSPITYTITGTSAVGGCSGKIFKLTVMPPGTTPAPTTHDTSYCTGATPVPISASAIGTVWYWTTPTGGTGTTTAPTPSTTTAGTFTWYVSQVVAGCSSNRVPLTVTVISPAAAISGATNVCVGSTATVTDATPGGSWQSSNTAIATIGSSTGVVTGVSAGVITITYLVSSGCYVTAPFTVYATPAAITGTAVVCVGATTTLANTLAGGTWSSTSTSIALVGLTTGIVSGMAAGTSTISYITPGGCYATKVVTVNPLPNPITGSLSVCAGLTTTLASTTPGGIWTSSAPGTATVGISTGIVTGVAAGTAIISYRVAGCNALATMNVISTPVPPSGTPYTCIGSTTTLTHPSSGGTWTSSTPSVATVGLSTGVVTGVSLGTTTITYSLGAGCVSTIVVTVAAAPPPMTGTLTVCEGFTTTLSHITGGGTWVSSNTSVATISGSGVVTGILAGTSTITYTVPSGCYTMSVVTVNPLPAIIIGSYTLCVGSTAAFSSSTPGITWSSSNATVATVGATTGIVTGVSAGTVNIIETITATGCPRAATVTVNPLPAVISGSLLVCPLTTTVLTDATAGGTWGGGSGSVATIDAAGTVTGVAPGTTTVTYTLSTGCFRTAIVTVNTPPASIGGSLAICMGSTSALTDATPGGTWSSSNTTVATVGISTGVVSGLTTGTSTITYTVTSTGCFTTAVVTVNTAPTAITGALAVCIAQNTSLSSATGGGTWTSSNTLVATIGGSSGVVTGVAAGTSGITYSLGGTCVVTAVVTVTPLPSAITGTTSVCVGLSQTLADTSPGGTWSISPTSVATIISGTGVYTGVSAGTATVTYTTGCFITTTVTVNPLPAVITGTPTMCPGTTTALSDATPGGTWASSVTSVATIDAAGLVSGVAPGTSTITYTLPTGCIKTTTVTVNALPATIGGTASVCIGSTTVLSDATSGGTWTSSDITIATIGTSTGVVTGIAAGTATITYTLTATGCIRTITVTVNPLPAVITGISFTVCPGTTTTLSDATPGGVWSSGSAAIASVGGTTGIVTGNTPGSVTINYTLSATGCRRSTVVTVNPLPGPITGTTTVCVGLNTTLSDATPGGTWSATAGTGSVTVGPTTGIVSGVTAGTAIITYTVGSGCQVTTTVTINPQPSAISGTLSVCVGSTTTLSSATTGGAWISSNTSVATIGASTGVLTGIAVGTSTITYILSTGCYATSVVTVTTTPTAITGTLSICVGATSALSSTPTGGVWTSSNTAVATISGTGIVTGVAPGTSSITYSLGTGCISVAIVTVNPNPTTITGILSFSEGLTTTLSSTPSGGTWSSSNTTVATVGAGSGVVSGISGGTSTITYMLSSGCYVTTVVTVNPLPPGISGDTVICAGVTGTLTDGAPGGTWSSSNTSVATIGISTGLITGVSAGTSIITYMLSTGTIATARVTVNPLPGAITGTLAICQGFTSALADGTPGGTWSSSTTSVATVSATGVVSSVSAGTSTITYKLTATGCYQTATVTVNPLPATIAGSSGFCNLTSTTMSSASPGGTWTTSAPSVATIDPSSGVITGVDTGIVIITYTLPTGCITTKVDSIIFAPYPIGGPTQVCEGGNVTLTNSITGGTWSSSSTTVATIGSLSGIATGNLAGISTITYVVSTGCSSSVDLTVNATPAAITGTTQVCVGLTTTLSNSLAGGGWSSSNPAVADIGISTGVVTGLDSGTTNITYSTTSGCTATTVVTVNPLPAAIMGTAEICAGLCTSLSDATAGGTWMSADPSVASVSGSGVACGISSGTTTIIYTLPTSCLITRDVTVDPLPSAITGTMVICEGNTATLSNISAGGAWSSSNPAIASIDAAGVVTGNDSGTVTITYTLSTGCIATADFTVNPLPSAIGGNLNVCAGFMSNLTNTLAGGIWSMSGSTTVATIHPLTGVVTGITPGTITVTYTLGTGCSVSAVVTVNPLPPAITGTAAVCENSTTVLADAVSGGTWTSSDAAIATVDPSLGVVTGMSSGNATITYTITTGCINIRNVTVNPLPGAITGDSLVCEHFTTTLGSTPAGQAWTSSNTVIASVGLTSGVVTGIAAGTTSISYTIVATGCTRTRTMTVNPTPAPITGSSYICIGQTSSLGDTYPGGSWSSSNTIVATIGSATGVASGLTFGSSVITYQLPVTGCYVTKSVTVSPLPNVYTVSGGGHYCAGGTGVYDTLSGSQIGVSYVIYYGSSATGYLTGTGSLLRFGPLTVAGVYTVLATNATSGCSRNMSGSATVFVDPLVTPTVTVVAPSGTDTVCSGGPRTFTAFTTTGGGSPGYIWKVNGLTVGSGNTYTFIPADGDSISITMNSTLACASPATVNGHMKVKVLPMVMPMVSVTADPGDTVCQFTLASFAATSLYGGSSPTYTWMVNGGVVGTGTTFAYEPTHNDVVTVVLTSNYQCRLADTVASGAVVMAVDPMTVPHVTITASPGLMVSPGETVTLSTTVTDAGVSPTYQWKVNGVPVPGATTSTYTSTFNHYDSVTCMVTSDGWCRDITTFDWVFITIAPLGVQQAGLGGDLMLLPNPNKGEFTIRGTLGSMTDQELTAEVTDMLGQVVYRSKVSSKQGRVEEHIQLDHTLANGMYMLNLRSESGSKVFHFVMEQ